MLPAFPKIHVFFPLGVLLLFLNGCHVFTGRPEPPPPASYESLMQLLADFMRFEDVNVYRVRPVEDLSGQNAWRATLQRLDYFEQARPGEETDIVEMTRGKCWARLGEYRRAVESFSRVASMGGQSPLSGLARERAARLLPLREVALMGGETRTVGDFLNTLEARRSRLRELEEEYRGSYDEILVRRDLEQTEVEMVMALFRNRFVLQRGSERALDLAGEMLENHVASARIEEHRLRLGRFYMELARDMSILTPPDGAAFDLELYDRLSALARSHIAEVARADGRLEKPEAEALLLVLNALDLRVHRLNP